MRLMGFSANGNGEANYELSIVIPIYNGERHIETKLKSLFEIEDVKYELILVVNKSSDKSKEIVKTLSKGRKDITVINQQSFVSAGRNFQTGVEMTRGNFVFVSAVDDVCDKEFYSEALEKLKKFPNICAVAPKTIFANVPEGKDQIEFELLGSVEDRLRGLIKNIRISHSIFYSMVRKDLAKKLYENFEHDFDFVGGDWLYDLRLAMVGEVCRTESKCIYGVRGASRSDNALWKPGDSWAKRVFPYKNLALRVLELSRGKKFTVRLILWNFCFGLILGNIHRYIFYVKDSVSKNMRVRKK